MSQIASTAQNKARPQHDISNVQFLVVDDYDFVRRIVTEGLKSCGTTKIHAAQHGREAIAFLKHRSATISDSGPRRHDGFSPRPH